MRKEALAIMSILAGAIIGFAGSVQSYELSRSERRELVRACRPDVARLCAGIRPGGGAIAQCLHANQAELSGGCRTAIASAVKDSGRAADKTATLSSSSQISVYRDIAYGDHPKQRMDIYVPRGATNVPVIFMVHGGAWAIGSKAVARVVNNKINYWLPKGFIFISVDNRLLPDADPLAQAHDVAKALAVAQDRVRSLGGDPRRFVLMGHSAGAHLVTLLSADPAMATRVGAQPWRCVVALDSAAYDVAKIMRSPHPRLYDRAFGNNPGLWWRASPSAQLRSGAPPMLLICSSRRRESCDQAEDFKNIANGIAVSAHVLPLSKSHAAINEDLGKPGAYTDTVDRFIQAAIGR